MRKKLIVITGPTAVGKTDLCLEVAESLRVPIINADSRQLFRDLKIGTAAPTEEQLARVNHYFVGTLGISDYYSASMYEQDVMKLLEELFQESDYALLSGGSMMYIDAVCNGIALEICIMTGQTYTSFRKAEKKARPFDIIKIGLNRDREELYNRINCRVDQMMADGLLDEVKRMNAYRNVNALNTVGYKELFNYLDNIWTLEEAVERIKGNTRRYARKQLTWFKRDTEMRWFHPDDKQMIKTYISQYE